MNDNQRVYVIIHGSEWSLNSDGRDPNEYIAHIVYGEPEITTVVVNRKRGGFVALCEYERVQETNARYTFERMGSFPFGAQFIADRETALREFGSWIYHYSATKRIAVA